MAGGDFCNSPHPQVPLPRIEYQVAVRTSSLLSLGGLNACRKGCGWGIDSCDKIVRYSDSFPPFPSLLLSCLSMSLRVYRIGYTPPLGRVLHSVNVRYMMILFCSRVLECERYRERRVH